jgi:hypothetical protein
MPQPVMTPSPSTFGQELCFLTRVVWLGSKSHFGLEHCTQSVCVSLNLLFHILGTCCSVQN